MYSLEHWYGTKHLKTYTLETKEQCDNLINILNESRGKKDRFVIKEYKK